MGPLPNANAEHEVVDFLVRLTWAAAEYAPLWPTAAAPAEGDVETGELLLDGWDTESDLELMPSADEESEVTLSFDHDPEMYGHELPCTEGGS